MATGTAVGIAIGFAAANLIGFLFTRFDHILGDLIPKLSLYVYIFIYLLLFFLKKRTFYVYF